MPQYLCKTFLVISLTIMLFFSACICVRKDNIEQGVKVNGVTLNYENEVTLSEGYDSNFLTIDGETLSLNIKGSSEPKINLQLKYWEYKPGDAKFSLKKEKLSYETKSGKPVSLFSITGSIPKNLNLNISTGTGKVNLSDMIGEQTITIQAGTGSIIVSESKLKKLSAETGTGSIIIDKCNIDTTLLESGTGSVHLNKSNIDMASVNTGTGNIILENSNINKQYFETGTGLSLIHI